MRISYTLLAAFVGGFLVSHLSAGPIVYLNSTVVAQGLYSDQNPPAEADDSGSVSDSNKPALATTASLSSASGHLSVSSSHTATLGDFGFSSNGSVSALATASSLGSFPTYSSSYSYFGVIFSIDQDMAYTLTGSLGFFEPSQMAQIAYLNHYLGSGTVWQGSLSGLNTSGVLTAGQYFLDSSLLAFAVSDEGLSSVSSDFSISLRLTPIGAVPDTGSSLGLFGAAIFALALGRRMLSRAPRS